MATLCWHAPPMATAGTLAYYGGDGNMHSALNPATGLPYGDYYSQCYARRALATNSYIDFNANGTYYFSVRFVGGSGWDWWTGDMAGGVGFAAGNATNADFVGAGWTRLSPFLMDDGVTDAGSAAYVTTGTLDQAGLASHPDDSGGPYHPRAAGSAGALLSGGPGFLSCRKADYIGWRRFHDQCKGVSWIQRACFRSGQHCLGCDL